MTIFSTRSSEWKSLYAGAWDSQFVHIENKSKERSMSDSQSFKSLKNTP